MLPSKGEGNTGAPGALHRHAQPSEMNFSQPLQHLDCPSEAPNVWTTISELCFSTSENTLYSRPHSIFSHSERRKGLASVFRLHRSGQSNVKRERIFIQCPSEAVRQCWGHRVPHKNLRARLSFNQKEKKEPAVKEYLCLLNLSCVLIRLFI